MAVIGPILTWVVGGESRWQGVADGRHFALIAGVVRPLTHRLLGQDMSSEVRGGPPPIAGRHSSGGSGSAVTSAGSRS